MLSRIVSRSLSQQQRCLGNLASNEKLPTNFFLTVKKTLNKYRFQEITNSKQTFACVALGLMPATLGIAYHALPLFMADGSKMVIAVSSATIAVCAIETTLLPLYRSCGLIGKDILNLRYERRCFPLIGKMFAYSLLFLMSIVLVFFAMANISIFMLVPYDYLCNDNKFLTVYEACMRRIFG